MMMLYYKYRHVQIMCLLCIILLLLYLSLPTFAAAHRVLHADQDQDQDHDREQEGREERRIHMKQLHTTPNIEEEQTIQQVDDKKTQEVELDKGTLRTLNGDSVPFPRSHPPSSSRTRTPDLLPSKDEEEVEAEETKIKDKYTRNNQKKASTEYAKPPPTISSASPSSVPSTSTVTVVTITGETVASNINMKSTQQPITIVATTFKQSDIKTKSEVTPVATTIGIETTKSIDTASVTDDELKDRIKEEMKLLKSQVISRVLEQPIENEVFQSLESMYRTLQLRRGLLADVRSQLAEFISMKQQVPSLGLINSTTFCYRNLLELLIKSVEISINNIHQPPASNVTLTEIPRNISSPPPLHTWWEDYFNVTKHLTTGTLPHAVSHVVQRVREIFVVTKHWFSDLWSAYDHFRYPQQDKVLNQRHTPVFDQDDMNERRDRRRYEDD